MDGSKQRREIGVVAAWWPIFATITLVLINFVIVQL